jgi:hypothetical protein
LRNSAGMIWSGRMWWGCDQCVVIPGFICVWTALECLSWMEPQRFASASLSLYRVETEASLRWHNYCVAKAGPRAEPVAADEDLRPSTVEERLLF